MVFFSLIDIPEIITDISKLSVSTGIKVCFVKINLHVC